MTLKYDLCMNMVSILREMSYYVRGIAEILGRGQIKLNYLISWISNLVWFGLTSPEYFCDSPHIVRHLQKDWNNIHAKIIFECHLIIIWWSTHDHLKNIWEGSDYFRNYNYMLLIIIWCSCDSHIIMNRLSSDDHLKKILEGTDYLMFI